MGSDVTEYENFIPGDSDSMWQLTCKKRQSETSGVVSKKMPTDTWEALKCSSEVFVSVSLDATAQQSEGRDGQETQLPVEPGVGGVCRTYSSIMRLVNYLCFERRYF